MVAQGRHRSSRRRHVSAADGKPVRGAVRLWRVATVAVSLAVAGIVVVALSSPASAGQVLARTTLIDANGVEVGKVAFKGMGKYAERVRVDIVAPDVPNLGGFHGLHIHTTGECDPNPSGIGAVSFGSAGGHWNPTEALHGAHLGDLPSVLLTPKGEAFVDFETARIDVAAMLEGDGSAVVLHIGPDNFANIPNRTPYPEADATTLATGDAGGRYACGVLEPMQ